MNGDSEQPLESSRPSEPVRKGQRRLQRILALRRKYKNSVSSSDDFAAGKAGEIALESKRSKRGE
jgi:hypothetical protein